MTKETGAVLHELLHKNDAPSPAPAQVLPMQSVSAPAAGAPPPSPAGGGFIKAPPGAPVRAAAAPTIPQTQPISQTPDLKKGEFTIKVIASIQQIYASEHQKQEQLQGNLAQGMGLKPGWGGQG